MENHNYLKDSATHAELTNLAGNVRSVVNKAALADDYLNSENQGLQSLEAQMQSGMNKTRGKELTGQMEAADTRRDQLFKALVLILRALLLWNKALVGAAAQKLYQLLQVHGAASLTRLSYEKQSARMDAIKQAMQAPEYIQALADTELTDLWNDLVQAQDNFAALYLESASREVIKDGIKSSTSLRPLLVEKLNGMIDYLKVMGRVDNATYGTLQAEVNELVNKLNEKINLRLSRRNSGSETTETTETTEID
ncbi:MAG: hypothetical protein CVU09_14730 [Bacteroidetes bacterium HGW-Bacteroidetes-4]|jgi:isoleucyl-tRNA synthetase|nr:MAG: hypothetical protein CVU09_14730 [Bacteroidetes bacterium HGW-Bacteroidetes-4]